MQALRFEQILHIPDLVVMRQAVAEGFVHDAPGHRHFGRDLTEGRGQCPAEGIGRFGGRKVPVPVLTLS